MVFRLLQEISRPHWMDILASLKKSPGKAVGEIASEIGLSYMGAKQHCDSLTRLGFLEAFRRPRPVGRPEKLYRLTAKALPLFPAAGNQVVLDLLKIVGDVYGHAAPEKLLYNFFQARTAAYKAKVKGKSVVERATALAKIRDAEGHVARVAYDKAKGFRIEEYHHPMEEILKTYPVLLKAEERMIEQVVGSKVTREAWKHGGHTIQLFYIATL